MNIGKLEKNLRDLILEEQIKLGYRKELLRLYYPLSSLNHLLGVNCTEAEMLERMKEFSEATQEHFGGITASSQKERFCIQIPPEGVEYVHEHQEEDDFLVKFIETIARHGCTLKDVETLLHSIRIRCLRAVMQGMILIMCSIFGTVSRMITAIASPLRAAT